MRTLVVAAEYPWPVNSGSRIRLSSTLRGLRAVGAVDLFSIVSDSRSDFSLPPDTEAPDRSARVAIDDRTHGPLRFATALARVDLPFELPWRSRRQVTAAVARFAAGPYDLVWYFRVRAWVLAGGEAAPTPAPATVVDLDDLEDQKILARLSIPPADHPGAGTRLRRLAGRGLWSEEIRRWRSLHRRIARHSDATVVCSALDAARTGLSGTRIVPNGYPEPSSAVDHAAVGSPPVVLFQGTLRYPPTADAARFLAGEIAPRLRSQVDDARVRLVGIASPSLEGLHDPPRVTVAGQVPDIAAELDGADVVVVPLRFGSGTRVKIIEAFAHRVPVVSTTLGAEGLDVDDGVHLLLADSADDIARTCERLLRDRSLRTQMVERAHHLYATRYRSEIAEAAVTDARLGRARRRPGMKRVRVVAQDFPWPASLGSHPRLDAVIRATMALGETDLFAFVPARRDEPRTVPPDIRLARVETVTNPRPDASFLRRAQWLASPGVPLEVFDARSRPSRERFAHWAGRYDFVWFSKATTYELLGRPRLGPTVVDLDDLEDAKILGRLRALGGDGGGGGGPGHAMRRTVADAQARRNAARWHRLQRSVATDADRVVLCSDLDVARLGVANAVVVPNGYRAPEVPVGRAEAGEPPTFVFPANFCYGPNTDAARWLVHEILPELRRHFPDVAVRLVGEPDTWLAGLRHPGVTVTGRVPAMEPELARADAVVVPIRFGSGTRIKILEAFAHRLPVVSTTMGAEGLDVVPDQHLLLADDLAYLPTPAPPSWATPPDAAGFVSAAEQLFLDRYQWSSAGAGIRDLALELHQSGRPRLSPVMLPVLRPAPSGGRRHRVHR